MMGAPGARNKVRSFILYSSSFTQLSSVVSLFLLLKLNALKHFPPLPSSTRLTAYTVPSADNSTSYVKPEKSPWPHGSVGWSIIPFTKKAVGSIPGQDTYLG